MRWPVCSYFILFKGALRFRIWWYPSWWRLGFEPDVNCGENWTLELGPISIYGDWRS